MSDRDLTSADDELGARIGGALQRHADRTDPIVPAASTIREAARRQDRSRRLQLGALVMAAAVVFGALILVRRGDDDAAYYGTGPGTTEAVPVPEPLHLVLDSSELAMFSAVESHPTASGHAPGTTPAEGPSELEVIVYSGPDRVGLPRLILTVRTRERPSDPSTAPSGGLSGNDRPIAVGGRPAVVRQTSAGATLIVEWDETHDVAVSFPGLDQDTTATALATLGQEDDGRWSLAAPPPGMAEAGRAALDAMVRGWYSDQTVYHEATIPSESSPGGLHRLTITRVGAGPHDDDILALALQAGQGAAATVERTTVRGHDAVVVRPSADGPLQAYTYAWFEPDHQVVVLLQIDTADRARADRLVASVRELGPPEWSALVASCPSVTVQGTIAPNDEGRTGGSCPR